MFDFLRESFETAKNFNVITKVSISRSSTIFYTWTFSRFLAKTRGPFATEKNLCHQIWPSIAKTKKTAATAQTNVEQNTCCLLLFFIIVLLVAISTDSFTPPNTLPLTLFPLLHPSLIMGTF